MLYYERKFKRQGFKTIIGVDEVGRGPLAGPLVAAAVNLKAHRFKNRIDDSKKLTPKARQEAFFEIIDKSVFGLGIINEVVIDRLNILQANRLAMEHAVYNLIDKLKQSKSAKEIGSRICVLIDGNIKLDLGYSCQNIIKGDGKSKSIACASIIAKVVRVRIMYLYDKVYPEYGFIKHKGYPTRLHRNRLRKFGPSLIHRKTFSYV